MNFLKHNSVIIIAIALSILSLSKCSSGTDTIQREMSRSNSFYRKEIKAKDRQYEKELKRNSDNKSKIQILRISEKELKKKNKSLEKEKKALIKGK